MLVESSLENTEYTQAQVVTWLADSLLDDVLRDNANELAELYDGIGDVVLASV
jgi:hypothetical protein